MTGICPCHLGQMPAHGPRPRRRTSWDRGSRSPPARVRSGSPDPRPRSVLGTCSPATRRPRTRTGDSRSTPTRPWPAGSGPSRSRGCTRSHRRSSRPSGDTGSPGTGRGLPGSTCSRTGTGRDRTGSRGPHRALGCLPAAPKSRARPEPAGTPPTPVATEAITATHATTTMTTHDLRPTALLPVTTRILAVHLRRTGT